MSHAASPCPDADPAVTAAPSASSQLAGIRELVRIAELQARAYAQAASAEDTLVAGVYPAEPAPEGCERPPVIVPQQRPTVSGAQSQVSLPSALTRTPPPR
jgi:hypothetical protein